MSESVFLGKANEDKLQTLLENVKNLNTYPSGAKKGNKSKLRFDLIPAEADKALAEVFTYGCHYGDRNWEKGIDNMSLIASLKRHLNSYELGEDLDESGYNHMKHVLANAAMIVTNIERDRLDLDTRPCKNKLIGLTANTNVTTNMQNKPEYSYESEDKHYN